jgi:hypothetical protein
VWPGGYRHLPANQADERRLSGSLIHVAVHFQNQLHFRKVFIMRQSAVTAPAFPPVPAPTFTAAAIRFVVSLGALISISLLLAGL